MRKYITAIFMALALLVSFSASAWNAPVTAQQVSLNTLHMSNWKTPDNNVTPLFYSTSSNLAQVKVFNLSGVLTKKHLYSFSTKIGGSQFYPNGSMYFNIMCPDGRNSTLVNHINIARANFQPYVNLNRDDGTACGSSTPPPPPAPNQTSISTIQNMYGPNYTVVRMFSDQDIFSVRCTAIPACEVYDGIITRLTPGVTYLSNTQKIAYRWSRFEAEYQFVAVRTKDTVTDQTAKDDIDVLVASGVEGQPWSWVDYTWNPKFTSWMD